MAEQTDGWMVQVKVMVPVRDEEEIKRVEEMNDLTSPFVQWLRHKIENWDADPNTPGREQTTWSSYIMDWCFEHNVQTSACHPHPQR